MLGSTTPDTLHRTAKYFMDSGRAASHAQAMDMLQTFGLNIEVGPEVACSRDHQIALLTLVNAARRTFLGGINVVGVPIAPLLVPLADADTLCAAIDELGGVRRDKCCASWPVARIGSIFAQTDVTPAWQVTWDGWRGGIIPVRFGQRLNETPSGGIAPALASAICAAEVFAFHASDHPMAGRRAVGLSLWQPRADWLLDDITEPKIAYLPSNLWLIGLGNLGQAYLWILNCLSFQDRNSVQLMLQDFDRLAPSNDSTSVLTWGSSIGQMKTRAMAVWLERRSFRVTLEERRFGQWITRTSDEPPVALCGVDNPLARASLEQAGFGLVIETGLGAGPQSFRSFALHTFPSTLNAAELWTKEVASEQNSSAMPAYNKSKHPELDECGLVQLASRTVGVPFVGLTAAAFAIAEILRRLHGTQGIEILSGSLLALENLEVCPMDVGPYEFGFVPATN